MSEEILAEWTATAGTGGGEVTSAPLAQFDNPYQSDTLGLAAGIIVAPPGESAPSIQDGSFRIPLAQYTIPEMGERPGLIKGSKESEEVAYIEIHEGIIVHPDWVRSAYVRELEKRIEELEKNSVTALAISPWQTLKPPLLSSWAPSAGSWRPPACWRKMKMAA